MRGRSVSRRQQEQELNKLQQELQQSAQQGKEEMERMTNEMLPKVQEWINSPKGEAAFTKTMNMLMERGYDENQARNQAFNVLFRKMTEKMENAIKEQQRVRDEDIRNRMEKAQVVLDGIDAQLRELGAL